MNGKNQHPDLSLDSGSAKRWFVLVLTSILSGYDSNLQVLSLMLKFGTCWSINRI
jgi:hypothetical protein